MPVRPVLHGDNGATTTVLAMLHWLGIKPSYSRPRVSDDNAFAEALFRTAKYRPEFPLKGFVDLDDARQWAMRFVQWYDHGHRHSGIRYVIPAQRHAGQDWQRLPCASDAQPSPRASPAARKGHYTCRTARRYRDQQLRRNQASTFNQDRYAAALGGVNALLKWSFS